MKHLLLFVLLLTASFRAQAQLAQFIGAGINIGRLAVRNNAAAADKADQLYVTQTNYNGEGFARKRTPAGRLPSKGGPQIRAVEELLTGRYNALQADATAPFLTPAWEAEYAAAMQALTAAKPAWGVAAYNNEVEFYRLLNERRQRAQRATAVPAPVPADH